VLNELEKLLKLFISFTREYGLGRALLRVVVWVAMIVLAPRHDIKIKLRNGCELFVIRKDIGISAELRVFKIHEPLATKILMRELKKGMVVVDIGSNIGYYVVLESKLVGSKGLVVAVEPDPVNFSYLLRNIRLNKLRNVMTVNKAISDRDGTINMIKSNRSNWSRVLQTSHDLAAQDVISVVEVQAVTLDNLIKQLGLNKVDFIRMDVEGHEDYIIRASENTIQGYLPDIFMEFHQFLIGKERFIGLLSKLHGMGYNIMHMIPRNIDFALLYRADDVTVRGISELIQRSAPDVFSAYITAHPDKEL